MASSSKGKGTLEDHYAALNIQNDDDVEVDLPYGDGITEEVESFMVVGTLITEKTVKFNFMKETLATVWRPVKGLVAEEISTNLFIFYFFHEKDRRRVLENGPWSFEQSLLVLHKLEHGESPYDADLKTAEFWVQIHKLPQKLATVQMVEAIGSTFGKFIKADLTNYDGTMKAFVRIRVRIDITKPLRRKVKINPPGGTAMTLECKYERLPTFCFLCGRIGHSESFCPIDFHSQDADLMKAYGPELRAVGRRSQNSENKWLLNQFPSKEPQQTGNTSENRNRELETEQNPRYEDQMRQKAFATSFCPSVNTQSGKEQSGEGIYFSTRNINEQTKGAEDCEHLLHRDTTTCKTHMPFSTPFPSLDQQAIWANPNHNHPYNLNGPHTEITTLDKEKKRRRREAIGPSEAQHFASHHEVVLGLELKNLLEAGSATQTRLSQ